MANYMQAYLCDILLGHAQHVQVDEFNETHTRIVLLTDCRSLFDHLVKDGSVPDDRWVAVSVAALRCALSAGPGREKRKAECKWVATEWQLADCLTKIGLDAVIQLRMKLGDTRLHEESNKQKQKKNAAQKSSKVHCAYQVTHLNSDCDLVDSTSPWLKSLSGGVLAHCKNIYI
jgi:hypothetical protein